jgi:hypothetical protein
MQSFFYVYHSLINQITRKITQETGASVTTKGTWYPDKSQATESAPALYLHVTAATQESLDNGIAKIMELLNQDMPLTEHKRDVREPRERVGHFFISYPSSESNRSLRGNGQRKKSQ